MGEGVEISNAYLKKISLDNFEAQPFRNTLLLQESMKFCVTMCLTFLIIFIDYAKAIDCVDHNKRWKIIKEMGISDHLTCLLRNLYASQEATVRTGHGTTDSKLGKEYIQVVHCHLAYLTSVQSTSWEMPGWMNHKLESRFPGEISIISDMKMIPSNGRKWRGTKEPLDEGERGEWKDGLKLNIQNTKIMASGPITSRQIEGENMEAMTDFIFLGSKITGDSDCSHKIKRRLLLGRKAMTNLDSILKTRDIKCLPAMQETWVWSLG